MSSIFFSLLSWIVTRTTDAMLTKVDVFLLSAIVSIRRVVAQIRLKSRKRAFFARASRWMPPHGFSFGMPRLKSPFPALCEKLTKVDISGQKVDIC